MVQQRTLLTLTETNCYDLSCWRNYQAPAPSRNPPQYRMLNMCQNCLSIIGEQKEISDILVWAWNLTGYRRRALRIRQGKGDPQNMDDKKTLADMETILRERFDDVLWVNVDPVLDPPLTKLELAGLLVDKQRFLREVEDGREKCKERGVYLQKKLDNAIVLGMEDIAATCEQQLDDQDVAFATKLEERLLGYPELKLSLLFKWK